MVCFYKGRVMRKPVLCLYKNKSAVQLRCNYEADQHHCFGYSYCTISLLLKSEISSNCTADQRLCFRFTDITIPPLHITKFSSFYLFYVTVQIGLCQGWSETQKTVFISHRGSVHKVVIALWSVTRFVRYS